MPEKPAKLSINSSIKQSLNKRYSEINPEYLIRIIEHILGGLSASQRLQASNHLHAFLHKIHINLKHNPTKLEDIHQAKKK